MGTENNTTEKNTSEKNATEKNSSFGKLFGGGRKAPKEKTENKRNSEDDIKKLTRTELLELLIDETKEADRLRAENERLRLKVQENDMKLTELGKLSVGVAKKSSQDEVLKALRTYVNVSKRKTLGKRAAVKVMIMELGNAISLTFPEDMIATLESLDDEQAEPKMVNVAGNYNDIHDNGSVNN